MRQSLEETLQEDGDTDIAFAENAERSSLWRYRLEVFGEELYSGARSLIGKAGQALVTIPLYLIGGLFPAEAQRDLERRHKIEADEAAALRRIEEAERAARLQREEEDRKARLAREADEARIKAEREKIDAERRALEEAARAEQFRKDEEARAARRDEQIKREAEENARAMAEREARRKEQERMDAREALESFCERFGHLPEFGYVVVAIRSYLEKKAA